MVAKKPVDQVLDLDLDDGVPVFLLPDAREIARPYEFRRWA
jgi:hypothetical protein